MPYATSKFKKIELEPGEEWVAGAFAMPAGGASRQLAAGAIGGGIGAAVASSGKSSSGGFDLPRKFPLGLTNKRLLVCNPDMLWGRPKNVAFAVPLRDIASVSLADPGKLSQQATFFCKDGRTLTVEAMTKGKSWLRELVGKAEALLR